MFTPPGWSKSKKMLKKSQVRHIANLAQLKLSEKEVKKFQKQLSDILDYIGQLEKLNTGKVEPTNQVTGLENVSRQDKVRSSLPQNEALSGSKKKNKGYFQVKSVFEGI